MALRRQINKDVPSESQQMDEDSQEDDDHDDKDEFSSSLLSTIPTRGTRRKEREQKSKPKEMTEEEMMDLALRLSEQEASVTALRQQEEEEAVMKAIQESMSQTQPCSASQTQILLPEAEASLRLCSRRKLLYSNGETESASEERSGATNNNRNKKRRRKEEGPRLSPLLEMPDLSQSQKISSQVSSCSSESVCVLLDSPQSCDSTQIDDSQLGKSPVFPLTGCRAEVQVPRLSTELLETCRSSGFVLCSQDGSSPSPQKSPPAQHTSPTFSKSPGCIALPESTAPHKSPVFPGTGQGDGDGEQSPEYLKSPVFGRNTEHETLPSACKASSENSGFMFSSQESLCSSVRPASCRSRSPVFVASPKSPVASETERGPDGQTEQSHGCSASPERRQDVNPDPDPVELRDSSSDDNPANESQEGAKDASVCLQQDRKTDLNPDGRSNESSVLIDSDDSDKLKETSEDWKCGAESELTSDMTLHWSEEDDDVTPVASPSPVFPEEKLVHQADDTPAASLNHVTTAASPNRCVETLAEDQSSSNKHISLRPSTSSSSTSSFSTSTQPQPSSTAEREPQPIGLSQGGEGGSASGGSTVHYYWGIPFCPQGLDPDSYTQVILAQMEVYEKSLKQAQRRLLRKAEWGDAILPEPEKSPSPEPPAESSSQQLVTRRRGLRLRGRKLSEAADTPPGETAAEEEEEDEKKEEERGKEGEEERNERQEEGGVEEEGQVDTDDCAVCPETQLSDNDSTQDLMIATDDGAELQPKSPEKPEVEMILQVDSPAVQETQGETEMMEVDAPAVTETEGNNPVSSQKVTKEEEERGDPDVEEIKDRRLPRSTSPELELLVVPRSAENNVDCPICQRSFPVTEIEMHAAYCDGEVAVMDEKRAEAESRVSLKPRRKRTRRAAEEPADRADAARNQEKCFICQKAVPLREYSRHTELCIQQQASKTAAKGNLLSALQHTESRDSEAGPSGSRLQTADVIDLRDDDDDDEDDDGKDEGGGTGQRFRISNSPIRSFTPISEASGCLINFRKQQPAKKPSQRRR